MGGNLSKTVTIVYFRFVCEKNQCHALVHASVDANMYNRMNRPGNVDDSFVEVCVGGGGGGGGRREKPGGKAKKGGIIKFFCSLSL